MSAFKILIGKPIGKRHLRRPRQRWEDKEDNIRMDFKEISVNKRNWVELMIGIIGEVLKMLH